MSSVHCTCRCTCNRACGVVAPSASSSGVDLHLHCIPHTISQILLTLSPCLVRGSLWRWTTMILTVHYPCLAGHIRSGALRMFRLFLLPRLLPTYRATLNSGRDTDS